MSKTLVTFLLDKSGSMESIRNDTIGAFNAYLDGLKQDGEGIHFSLVLFDTISVEKIHVNQPIADVPSLTREVYKPHGGTPLIDAAYKTIKAVEKSVSGNPATKVIICIQTDGEENSSTEHRWDELNALIKEKTEAGWQFNFMGASIDAYQQASRMGISRGSTLSYDSKDVLATKSAFAASAVNMRAYASGESLSTEYTAEQKSTSGDRYAAKYEIPPQSKSPMHEAQKASQTPSQPTPKAPPALRTRSPKKQIVDDITL